MWAAQAWARNEGNEQVRASIPCTPARQRCAMRTASAQSAVLAVSVCVCVSARLCRGHGAGAGPVWRVPA
jgi:hypothetical protein